MSLQAIQSAIQQGVYFAGSHAQSAAIDDGLVVADIWLALLAPHAIIIEEYLADSRGASCLILCEINGQPVHVQIAYPAKWYATRQRIAALAFMITVYRPNARPHEWSVDYQTRLPQP